jgi:hypothetical protein
MGARTIIGTHHRQHKTVTDRREYFGSVALIESPFVAVYISEGILWRRDGPLARLLNYVWHRRRDGNGNGRKFASFQGIQ